MRCIFAALSSNRWAHGFLWVGIVFIVFDRCLELLVQNCFYVNPGTPCGYKIVLMRQDAYALKRFAA